MSNYQLYTQHDLTFLIERERKTTLADPTPEEIEAVARQICDADTKAPNPDDPILIGTRNAEAWEGRIDMAKAAIEKFLKGRR